MKTILLLGGLLSFCSAITGCSAADADNTSAKLHQVTKDEECADKYAEERRICLYGEDRD